MFDSAFGGDSDDFSTGGGTGTSAPTQAMETPLFGSKPEVDTGGGMGFDDDAFGMPTPDVGADAGTPVPDFSPDTGTGGMPDTGMPPVAMGAPPKKRGGAIGMLVKVLILLLVAVVGFAASPFLIDKISFLPNPQGDTIADLEGKNSQLQRDLGRALEARGQDTKGLSPEQLNVLLTDYENAKTNLNSIQSDLGAARGEYTDLESDLVFINADIEEKIGQFVEAQEALEDVVNETVITRAQYDGLIAENSRLTDVVGELEVANSRRQATKDTLLHNIDLLVVQIQGGSPLAPERFNHAGRLAKVTALRDKVARAKWVDPQLLDQFTNLYLAELGIASSREYFFARIPVHDQLDIVRYIWAECLMNGNWSVYYSTIDGKHVGSYENAAGSGPPRYEFREELPGGMRGDISDAIKASRVQGYEEKVAVLQQKQKIYDDKTRMQTSFSSL